MANIQELSIDKWSKFSKLKGILYKHDKNEHNMRYTRSKYSSNLDFTEFAKFKENFKGFYRLYNSFAKWFINEYREDILKMLMDKTFGVNGYESFKAYRTGLLYRSWKVSEAKGRGNRYYTQITNNAWHSPNEHAYDELFGKENTITFEMGGDGYYASFIEYGFTRKDGSFRRGRFIAFTTMKDYEDVLENQFPEFIKKMENEVLYNGLISLA